MTRYEYLVKAAPASSVDSLEVLAQSLDRALNVAGDVAAYAEMGWELWQLNTVNTGDPTGNNGFLLVYRRPGQ